MLIISILFFLTFMLVFYILFIISKYIEPVFAIGFIILGVIPSLLFTSNKSKDEYDIIGKIIEKLKGDKNDFFKKKK